MSRYLLVNASPRAEGTSAMLARRMAAQLTQAGHSANHMNLYPNLRRMQTVVDAFADADTLVVFGPCYINTYPADTYALLEAMAQTPDACHGQRVYGVIQGGMPYAHTHASGLSALRLFARACGLAWGGGFVMGMGAMLNGQPMEKLINAKAVICQYDAFCAHVARGEDSPAALYEQAQLRMPGFVWRLMSGWMNRRIDREAAKWGIPKEKVGACFYPMPEAEA